MISHRLFRVCFFISIYFQELIVFIDFLKSFFIVIYFLEGMMFHYYIKIVPTLYVNEEGMEYETDQYSVTKYEKVTSPISGNSGMPGIFFSYEFSALMVKISNKSVPMSHLITDLCSIVGGVWIVSMFIDALCYRSSKILSKIELGKAS